MSKRLIPILLGLAAVALLASVALAAGSDFSSLSRHSKTAALASPGQNAKAKAECPNGKSSVSGGFDAGALSFDHGPVVTASRAKGGAWEARADEFAQSGPQQDQITGDVNCAVKAPKITKETAHVQVPSGGFRSAKATCSGGSHAVAGGFKTTYDGSVINGVIVTASFRSSSKTWKVVGSGTSNSTRSSGSRLAGRGTQTYPLTAYVYCADVSSLNAHSKRVRGTSMTQNGQLHANAKCGKHQTAVSGGFKSQVIPGPPFAESNVPESSRLKGKRGWATSAFYFSIGGTPLSWRGYVYCAE